MFQKLNKSTAMKVQRMCVQTQEKIKDNVELQGKHLHSFTSSVGFVFFFWSGQVGKALID